MKNINLPENLFDRIKRELILASVKDEGVKETLKELEKVWEEGYILLNKIEDI